MGNETDIFNQVMYEMISAYGTDILSDSQRANAILMDYAPRNPRERKLIVSALEEGIVNELLRAREKSPQDQRLFINRCIRHLIDETWVTQEAAQFAVSVIAFSIGISSVEISESVANSTLPKLEEMRELKKGACDPNEKNLTDFLSQYKEIGYKAFAVDSRIEELELPQSIRTIGAKAFVDCVNLKRIVIGKSIEMIGYEAFAGCDALESIDMEKNANYAVVHGMLIDKKRKALIRATRSVENNCVIPCEVVAIYARAFERNDVQTVLLSKNLSELAGNAFVLCGKLQSIDIDPHNEKYSSVEGVLHTKDRKILIRFPPGYCGVNYIIEETVTHIADGAFSGTANIETITFTNTLKSIGVRAFEYCRKLSSIVLPSSVEIIGERAFQYSDKLSNVMLSCGIQEIGDYAFCGCQSIQTMSIPKEVKRIGHAAFKDCMSLRKVVIQNNVEFIGDGAFSGCADNMEVVINNNSYVERYCSAHKITWSAL